MADDALTVAVLGAAGLAGREVVRLLDERQFPVGTLRLLGSPRTAGAPFEEGDRSGRIDLVRAEAFDDVDIAIFSGGPALAGEWAAAATAAGAAVVDTSSRFRFDPHIPLVVPEVNASAIAEWREQGIVASPSSTAIGLTVVLAPILAEAGLRRVVATTYQSIAPRGRRALDALARQSAALLSGRGSRRNKLVHNLAFNVVPQVGALEPGGATTHEVQALAEVRRVLGQPELRLHVSAARVPTFFGAGIDCTIETERPLPPDVAAALLRDARGIVLHHGDADPYPTPADVIGTGATHVGRVRIDPTVEHGIACWIAIDNVGKGSALNAVQIAEILVRDHR